MKRSLIFTLLGALLFTACSSGEGKGDPQNDSTAVQVDSLMGEATAVPTVVDTMNLDTTVMDTAK